MKFLILIPCTFIFLNCSTSTKKKTEIIGFNQKELPQFDVNTLINGSTAFKAPKSNILAVIILDFPDYILYQSRDKASEDGLALKELKNIQEIRKEWFEEAILSNCETCPNIDVEIPLAQFSENNYSSLLDKIQSEKNITWPDLSEKSINNQKYQYVWILSGKTSTFQKRGFTDEKRNIVAASHFKVLNVKSQIFDSNTKNLISLTDIKSTDQETILYTKQAEGVWKKATKLLPQIFKSRISLSEALNDKKYDDVYPYPDEPESDYIVQKTINKALEVYIP